MIVIIFISSYSLKYIYFYNLFSKEVEIGSLSKKELT